MNEASIRAENRQFGVLAFTQKEPHWLNLALQLDARNCNSPRFDWVSSPQEAIQAIRTRQFDVLIFGVEPLADLNKQVLAPLKAFQASGLSAPILLVTSDCPRSEQIKAIQNDLEILQDPLMWDSPMLLASVEKSMRLHQLRQEHLNWGRKVQSTLSQEQQETEQLLQHQTELLDQLKKCSFHRADEAPARRPTGKQPVYLENLALQYSELLKNYVVQDPEEMVREINQFVDQVVSADITPTRTMQLHLEQVQALMTGVGSRSGRYVLARADQLALKIMIRLAETFQNRQQDSQRY